MKHIAEMPINIINELNWKLITFSASLSLSHFSLSPFKIFITQNGMQSRWLLSIYCDGVAAAEGRSGGGSTEEVDANISRMPFKFWYIEKP